MHRCRHLLAFLALASTLATAGAQAVRSATEFPDTRIDVFGGYAYFHPITSGIDGHQFFDVYNPNATAAVSYWFNRFVGVQSEGGYFSGSSEHRPYDTHCLSTGCDQLIYTAQAGPILRYPLGAFIPYLHTLGGGTRMNGPVTQPLTWGWGVTGGIGLDYIVPLFGKRLAVRAFQADYQYSQVVYGPLVLPDGVQGGFNEVDALKVSSGLVLRIGSVQPRRPLMLGCAAEPTLVHPGEAVEIVGSAVDLDPHRKPEYTWQSNGGQLKPDGNHAAIDTTGLAPGDYTVTGHVAEGLKARQQANCTAVFSVKPFDPPSVACSADPANTTSGTAVNIIAAGVSPQNRALTYSFETSAGILNPAGPNASTAKLITDGLGASTVSVTCHVTDDLNQMASAIAQVTLANPVVPTVAETQSLCGISFERDRRRPVRVDNEAKACLDGIALTLTQQTDAKLVMIGNTSADEKPEAAAERVLNVREYLVTGKGIDTGRIELRLGETSGRKVHNVLVPTGAIFNQPNTQPFDEHQVTRHGQPYGKHLPGQTVRRRTIARRTASSVRSPKATEAPSGAPPVGIPADRTSTPAPVASTSKPIGRKPAAGRPIQPAPSRTTTPLPVPVTPPPS